MNREEYLKEAHLYFGDSLLDPEKEVDDEFIEDVDEMVRVFYLFEKKYTDCYKESDYLS